MAKAEDEQKLINEALASLVSKVEKLGYDITQSRNVIYSGSDIIEDKEGREVYNKTVAANERYLGKLSSISQEQYDALKSMQDIVVGRTADYLDIMEKQYGKDSEEAKEAMEILEGVSKKYKEVRDNLKTKIGTKVPGSFTTARDAWNDAQIKLINTINEVKSEAAACGKEILSARKQEELLRKAESGIHGALKFEGIDVEYLGKALDTVSDRVKKGVTSLTPRTYQPFENETKQQQELVKLAQKAKTVKAKMDNNIKILSGSKNEKVAPLSTFKTTGKKIIFDIEAFGDLGSSSYSPSQLTMKRSGSNKIMTEVIGLSEGILETWKTIQQKVETGQGHTLTPMERRMVTQATQYGQELTKNGRKITTVSKGWKDDVEITQMSKVWQEAQQGIALLVQASKAAGTKDAFVNFSPNLKAAFDKMANSKTGIGFSADKDTFIAENGQGYDFQAFKQNGIKIRHMLDTLPILRGAIGVGTVNKSGKKFAGLYGLEELAKFLEVDKLVNGTGYHTAEQDVNILDEIFKAIPSLTQRTDLTESQINEKDYLQAQRAFLRKGIYDFKEKISGSRKTLVTSSENYGDSFASAGDVVQWLGMVEKEVDGEIRRYGQFKNITKGENFYLLADSAQELAQYISGYFGGEPLNEVQAKKAMQENAIRKIFGANGAHFVDAIVKANHSTPAKAFTGENGKYLLKFYNDVPDQIKKAIIAMTQDANINWNGLSYEQKNATLQDIGSSLGMTKTNSLSTFTLRKQVEAGRGTDFYSIAESYKDFIERNSEYFTAEGAKDFIKRINKADPLGFDGDPFREIRQDIVEAIFNSQKYAESGLYGFSNKVSAPTIENTQQFLSQAQSSVNKIRETTINSGPKKNQAIDGVANAVKQVMAIYEGSNDLVRNNLTGAHLRSQVGKTGTINQNLISAGFGTLDKEKANKGENPFAVGSAGYNLVEMLAEAYGVGEEAIVRVNGHSLEIGLYNPALAEAYKDAQGNIDFNKITVGRIGLSDANGNIIDMSKINMPSVKITQGQVKPGGKAIKDVFLTSAVEEQMSALRRAHGYKSDGTLTEASANIMGIGRLVNNVTPTSLFSYLAREEVNQSSGMSSAAKTQDAFEGTNIDNSPLKNLVTTTSIDIMNLTKQLQEEFSIFTNYKGEIIDSNEITEAQAKEILSLINARAIGNGKGLEYIDLTNNPAYQLYSNALSDEGKAFHSYIDRIVDNIVIDITGQRPNSYGRQIKTMSLTRLNTFGDLNDKSAITLDQTKEGLQLIGEKIGATYGNYLASRMGTTAGVDYSSANFRLRKAGKITDDDIFRAAYGYQRGDDVSFKKIAIGASESIEKYLKRFEKFSQEDKNKLHERARLLSGEGALPSVAGGEFLLRDNLTQGKTKYNISQELESTQRSVLTIDKFSKEFLERYPQIAEALTKEGRYGFNAGEGVKFDVGMNIGNGKKVKAGSVLKQISLENGKFITIIDNMVEAFEGVAGLGATDFKGPIHYIPEAFAKRIAKVSGLDADTQMFGEKQGIKTKYVPDEIQSKLSYITSMAKEKLGKTSEEINKAIESLGSDSVLAKMIRYNPSIDKWENNFRRNVLTGELETWIGQGPMIEFNQDKSNWAPLFDSLEKANEFFNDLYTASKNSELRMLGERLFDGKIKYNPNMGMSPLTLRNAPNDWLRRATGGGNDLSKFEKGFYSDIKYREGFLRTSRSYGGPDTLFTDEFYKAINSNEEERRRAINNQQKIIDARELSNNLSLSSAGQFIEVIADEISESAIEELNQKFQGKIKFTTSKQLGLTSTRDRENGQLTQTAYNNLITTRLKEMADGINTNVIVAEGVDVNNPFGTSRVALPMLENAGGTEITEGDNIILDMFKRINNKEGMDIKSYNQAMDDWAFSNTGELSRSVNRAKVAHSAMPTLTAINTAQQQLKGEDLTNLVILPKDQFLDAAKYLFGDNDAENRNRLENWNQLLEALKGTSAENYKTLIESKGKDYDFKTVENEIFERLIQFLDISNPKGGYLQGLLSRFPFITGRDARLSKVRVDSSKTRGTMQLSQDLIYLMNGDTDTDFGEVVMPQLGVNFSPDKTGYQNMLTLLSEGEQKLTHSNETGRLLGLAFRADQTKMVTPEKQAESIEKVAADEFNGLINQIAGLFGKITFGEVGRMSNASSSVRMALSNGGIDELNANSSIEETIYSVLMRNIMRVFEQDAISSKKIGDRLRAQMDLGKAPEEARNAVIQIIADELTQLWQKLNAGDFKGALQQARKMQIIGENGIDKKIGTTTLAELAGIYKGNEPALAQLAQITGYTTKDNLLSAISSNNGVISNSAIEDTFSFLENKGFKWDQEMRLKSVLPLTEGNSNIYERFIARQASEKDEARLAQYLKSIVNSGKYIPASKVENATDYDLTHNRIVSLNEGLAPWLGENGSITLTGKDQTSITSIAKPFTERSSSKAGEAAIKGTYGHAIVEALVEAGTLSVKDIENNADMLEAQRAFIQSMNDAGEKNQDNIDAAILEMKGRAEMVAKVAQSRGYFDKNTVTTEHTMAGIYEGMDVALTGQADVIKEGADSITVGDYKFSKVNSSEERIYQANAYLFQHQKEVEAAIAKEDQKLLQFVDEQGNITNQDEYNKITATKSLLQAKLAKFKNGKIEILRNFKDKDGVWKTAVTEMDRLPQEFMESLIRNLMISRKGLSGTMIDVGGNQMSAFDYLGQMGSGAIETPYTLNGTRETVNKRASSNKVGANNTASAKQTATVVPLSIQQPSYAEMLTLGQGRTTDTSVPFNILDEQGNILSSDDIINNLGFQGKGGGNVAYDDHTIKNVAIAQYIQYLGEETKLLQQQIELKSKISNINELLKNGEDETLSKLKAQLETEQQINDKKLEGIQYKKEANGVEATYASEVKKPASKRKILDQKDIDRIEEAQKTKAIDVVGTQASSEINANSFIAKTLGDETNSALKELESQYDKVNAAKLKVNKAQNDVNNSSSLEKANYEKILEVEKSKLADEEKELSIINNKIVSYRSLLQLMEQKGFVQPGVAENVNKIIQNVKDEADKSYAQSKTELDAKNGNAALKQQQSEENQAKKEAITLLKQEYNLLEKIEVLKVSKMRSSGMEAIQIDKQINDLQGTIGNIQSERTAKEDKFKDNSVLWSQYQLDLEKEKTNFNVTSANINQNMKPEAGLLDRIIGGFKQQMIFMIDRSLAYQVFGKVRQELQNVITQAEGLDKALVNIQIATGNTRKETASLLQEYNKMANELGRTTQEVATASNDWLRAGYEGAEAAELTEASMKLSTLGMIESSQATTYLISTLKGWKLQASDVLEVVDKLTVAICGVCLVIGIEYKFNCR